jgi:hypothetical protein
MMARRLALVLTGAFLVSVLSVVLAGPAQAVCRPNCLDLNKHSQVRGQDRNDRDYGDRWERGKHSDRGKRHHYGWAKHHHKKHKHGNHRGHGGHQEPAPTPTPPPPVTPPPVEPPPPPPGPTPCIGC